MTLRGSMRALFTTLCVTVLALALAACGDFAVVVDGSYLERWIREPKADIVAGFDVVEMPTMDLGADGLDAIVDYIESLR